MTRSIKVLISAGHSNTDSGAVANGFKEADIITELRNIIASKIKQIPEFNLITDGAGSDNKPLKDAIALAKQCNIAIELHCNAASNASACGVEVISLPKDKILSQHLAKAIADVTKDKIRGDRGWVDQSKSARGKLGFVNAGGIIVELFFLTNKQSLDNYQSVKWLVASAIVKTLADYYEVNQ